MLDFIHARDLVVIGIVVVIFAVGYLIRQWAQRRGPTDDKTRDP